MRSHNNHALKRLVLKCVCLWGGGGGNNTIPWSNPSSIRYELATGKYNPHLFLTVKRIFNTESNHGISVEVKWIGIRHLMKKKGKIPLSLKPLYTSMKRQIARKTDRETHLNSLHLHMSYTDNLCKQLGPKSELTKCWSWSVSKLFDMFMELLKS